MKGKIIISLVIVACLYMIFGIKDDYHYQMTEDQVNWSMSQGEITVYPSRHDRFKFKFQYLDDQVIKKGDRWGIEIYDRQGRLIFSEQVLYQEEIIKAASVKSINTSSHIHSSIASDALEELTVHITYVRDGRSCEDILHLKKKS